jgi:orotidine-5'-phosphate decarboxylase
MSPRQAETRLIVALDVDSLDAAAELVRRLGPTVEWYKIGKQLFTRYGPAAVQRLKDAGKRVFLDLKFHDIPNTVAQAVRSAAAVGADLTNVHASGGPAMLRAAALAGRDAGIRVIAVTVLTSMDRAELAAIGLDLDPVDQVLRLAALSRDCGIAGVVCSPLEVVPIRQACGQDFVLVVPGIRPAGAPGDDQKRIMTPAQAAAAGTDYIVVGRPITAALDPALAAAVVLREIAAGAPAAGQ